MIVYPLLLCLLLIALTLAAYVDRVYSEMGKFLAREYQDNVDSWVEVVEPKLRLGRDSISLSASVLRQLSVAALGMLLAAQLFTGTARPAWTDVLRAALELILLVLIFDRLLPQVLFTRTRGLWIDRIRPVLQGLFLLILPVTLLLGLMLSIVALAEPEDVEEEEHPSEAVDALLEAGEEEGILEESDRELLRSVVEFGDKVVREVMTPRPEMYAVPGTMTLEEFTAEIKVHAFSRVPVYQDSLDEITGIAFAHDLLQVLDTDAGRITVASVARPAEFVPETKKVNELLREMQRASQHMRIVIDEYGGVAGLVTIEDLLEAIVGSISDEHDLPEEDDVPVREANGAFTVSGSFELSRLRDLFQDQFDEAEAAANGSTNTASGNAASSITGGAQPDSRNAGRDGGVSPQLSTHTPAADDRPAEDSEPHDAEPDSTAADAPALRLPEHYESTTLGGLVSEIAGHIPLPGEVVEESGLRLEVLASTDRRVERVRVSLVSD